MSFLYCKPSVFAIGNRYEILINTLENGQCAIKIDGKNYVSERAGILLSETTVHKISVPQSALDKAGCYTVLWRKSIDKKSYFSVFGEWEKEDFSFRGIGDKTNIKIYHVADVHYEFDKGVALSKFYGDDTDLFVINGDIGEVEKVQDFLDVAKFSGDVSNGERPVVFTRGNHDTRGKLASEFSLYFPTKNDKYFYTINFNKIRIIVLDCGEDKVDEHVEYGGANLFSPYRKKQTEFLKNIKKIDDKITFCISHMCPGRVEAYNPAFQIEEDTYRKWIKELERIETSFMLVGHTHKTGIFLPNQAVLPHNYPVIVGSALSNDKTTALGAGLELTSARSIKVKFTDTDCNVVEEYEIKI